MRIVIDLQACQHGTPEQRASARQLALGLVKEAGAHHDVHLVLSSQFGDTLAELRHAFRGLVPHANIAVFDVPSTEDTVAASGRWLARAGEILRAGVFDRLAPQVVLSLDFTPHGVRHLPEGVDPAIGGWSNVIRVGSAAALARAIGRDPKAAQGRLEHLVRADLLLADSQQDAEQLAALVPERPVAVLDGDMAALLRRLEESAAGAMTPPVMPTRARLAYISPLPPEKSGIADYSAELLPELAKYYDVEVILDQPKLSCPWVEANLPVRTVEYFEQHAADYQHRLYHFGNSSMHRHMFALLQRHPGVVVLHDFYLANALHAMHYSGYAPGVLHESLYRSHGFGALISHERDGDLPTVWKYPCNKPILDAATGIIVHSAYPKHLAEQWYGPDCAANWHTLPLLRGHPGGDQAALRQAARAELGLKDDEFLVCSFGMLGRTKLNDKLVDAWLASTLQNERNCQLVFVGELGNDEFARMLQAKIASAPGRNRIKITGFVTTAMYQAYLAACDVAVQLRAHTRGETSAAVLDCLLHGIPTVINAHGAMAELPAEVLVKLDDEFETGALAGALERLYREPATRAHLSRAGSRYIEEEHSPEHVGALYRDTLDRLAAHNRLLNYRRQIEALHAMPEASMLLQEDLLRCARALAANSQGNGPRQLLVDVSAMVVTDLKTGIQRVVRAILQALLIDPPPGFQVEAVYSRGEGKPYHYARAWMQHSLTQPVHDLDDAPIEVHSGDVFLGLDLIMHTVNENRAVLEGFRDRGMHIYFVVYDLLPVLRPNFFPFGAEPMFALWLDTIGTVSDGIVTISRAVADELYQWYQDHPPQRRAPLELSWFHLGADLAASAPTTGLTADAEQVLEQMAARPTVLMVGTLEPRKGHLQSLAAFDLLWKDGVDVNLVIVGKQGWMIDELAGRLNGHPLRQHKLFWLQGVSDEMLEKLYKQASCLLASSEGEGFGLPLIEAAQHAIPIIARGLPVFREVAGEHAFYFDGVEPAQLAGAVKEWLALFKAGTAPQSKDMPWLTWNDSAAQMKDFLAGRRAYRSVTGRAVE